MFNRLIILGICAGSAASVPILYQAHPQTFLAYFQPGQADDQSPAPPAPAEPEAAAAPAALSGRKVQLPSDEGGHYFGDFKLNGRKVQALVDTGATAVAINLSTARRIGVPIQLSDLTQSVNTANGRARAAVVTLDRVEIGRISIDKVRALVLEDRALSNTLVGMTFLNRLQRFQVDGGVMVLTQ